MANEVKTVQVSTLLAVNDIFAALVTAIVGEVMRNLPPYVADPEAMLPGEQELESLRERVKTLEGMVERNAGNDGEVLEGMAKRISKLEVECGKLVDRVDDHESRIDDIERSDVIDGTFERQVDEKLEELEEKIDNVEPDSDAVRRVLKSALEEVVENL